MKRQRAIVCAVWTWATVALPALAQTPSIRYEPTTFEVEGVGKVQAELGRFTVLEDRAKPQGRRIELLFGHLKSTAATPGAPIVFLDGGPGGSGVGAARIPAYYKLFDQMRGIGDVILIGQRGTGLSIPRLACRVDDAVPADVFASADRMTEILGPRAVACAAEWRGKGVDLSAYNTEASADDLEDLRLALGVAKIRLFGFSYGTHLGLAAIRRHPSSIERAVLAGTEGPDHAEKLPHTYDLQMARIAALEAEVSNAPAPGLVEVTKSLMAQLEAVPVQVDAAVQGPRTRRAAAPVPLK